MSSEDRTSSKEASRSMTRRERRRVHWKSPRSPVDDGVVGVAGWLDMVVLKSARRPLVSVKVKGFDVT